MDGHGLSPPESPKTPIAAVVAVYLPIATIRGGEELYLHPPSLRGGKVEVCSMSGLGLGVAARDLDFVVSLVPCPISPESLQ